MQRDRFARVARRINVSRFIGLLVIACILTMGQRSWAFAAEPIDGGSELSMLASRFEEPLIATMPTSPEEDAALLRSIQTYNARTTENGFQPLEAFLSDHPNSGWRVALFTNLGLSYYRNGYFAHAIAALEQAWEAGRSATNLQVKALVDRAAGELLRMHARLGHAEEIQHLLKDIGDRSLTGPATEALAGAREGLWMMQNDPGVAYLCGPMALKNLLLALGESADQVQFLDAVRSGPHGVTLAEVAQLADKAKLAYRLVQRDAGQPVPVPSIVHWKVSHFAAIVGERDGYIHVEDPTFGQDLWVTRAALDAESSGYFLVPTAAGTNAWREASADETAQIHGMGYTGTNLQTATTPQDDKTKPGQCGGGMCGYNFTEMTVSLNLQDIPVGYVPPKGPPVRVAITYNQREASQPANFSFFNVSPKWTLNWLSYIQDNPTIAGAGVTRYVAGGGSIVYSGYDGTTGAFTPEARDASVLVRTSANPITYQRRLSDGSVETYSTSNGATASPRLIFLTQKTDPFGNSVSLNYDAQLRLTSVVDATGRSTTFTYGLASKPLLITQITDPFGRSAQLAYDASGRLSEITDVLGLTSQFTYDAASLVNALTTPYGTTTFVYGDNGNSRFLQATDPLGFTERLEYLQAAPGIPFSDPDNLVPKGIVAPFNQYLTGRDTFYWDKHAYAVAKGDYTKARNKHWTHVASNTNVTADTVESIKYPLENRIWFNYPGQPDGGLGTALSGTLDKPSNIGRVLDDGTTQLTQLQYNSQGGITSIIDPLGRQTLLQYAPNQVDLVSFQQKTSATGNSTIAQFTYNTQHLPLTYTDAAGQTTTYTYNANGQLTQATDALGEVTQYQYDNLGYLVAVINANGKTAVSFTYDAQGRVATRTDSEGLLIAFGYDAMDRVIRQTYPDGTTREFTWDKLDLVTAKDRQGRITTYTYDAVRNLIAVADPLKQLTQLGYYENQQLKLLTDPNGHTTSWDIDIEDRLIAKHYADGKSVTNTYETTTSRLKAITDALGQTKQFTYGLDNRPTAIQYLNAVNATPNVSFAYDPFFPHVTSMTDGSGTTTYLYQPVGSAGALQLAQENGPYTNSAIGYQYDALGRVISRTVGGDVETFAYDGLGRPSSHADALGNFALSYLGETGQITGRQSTAVGTNWIYDTNLNDRRLTAITNSGTARSYQITTTPEYDITAILETVSGAAQQTWSYTYDAADRLLTATSSANTAASSNDLSEKNKEPGKKGDLGNKNDHQPPPAPPVPPPPIIPSGAAQYAYGYDAASNIPSITRPAGTATVGYNSVNQISTYNGTPFTYDANGNLLQDDLRSYQWDAENRLISITYTAQPGVSSTFRYDGRNRRIAIVTNNGAISSEARYLWCGQKLCQARSAADTVTRRYLAEGEVIPSSSSLLYYATDQLGSVRDVLQAQTATQAANFDYEPYGSPTQSAGSTTTDFRYAGLFFHQQSGLYLATYRTYDPQTGRWISRDPIGEVGGINLYRYAADNPISITDQTGRCPLCVAIVIGGLLGAGSDLVSQLIANHGDLSCVNGGQVLTAGLLGAAFGGIAAVPGLLVAESAAAVEGAEGFTTLYRAVGPAELEDIQATGAFRNLGSAEGKYFTTSGEAASSYAKQAVNAFGDEPYTIVQTRVPNSLLEGSPPVIVDRGIPAYVIPNEGLPGLMPNVLNYSPLPGVP